MSTLTCRSSVSVVLQGDCRSYNYVAALSSNEVDIDWPDVMTLAKIIPKICQSVNR